MNKKGFTLTEILIVMVVAGILLALILPNTLKAIERGNVTEHRNNINSIKVAILMCFNATRDFTLCDSEAELTADGVKYLESWPTNPFGGDYSIVDDATVSGKTACASSTSAPDDVAALECASE
ncbi:MAG: type II secretion system GspH family protein [Candidatus Omnitrophica bacterium]|nr:type II secretion system GspH family protein [Candidatus Omnitrophota bacterium]MBU1995596.1 type II secretion system GspH family protein [Candidatus Omnitrophota bacterium]MBU4333086.1 type II secretion system GspH family protein [Candidatus Omnitrophota bacterium]